MSECEKIDCPVESFINNANSVIFDEKIWIGQDMWKVAEVTYSYDKKTIVNETLFVTLGEMNLDLYASSTDEIEKEKLLLNALDLAKNKLKEKINLINKYLRDISRIEHSDETEKILKTIFINSLNEKKDLLNYCIFSLYIEFEKTGLKSGIKNEELKILEEKAQKIDKKLFGGDIRDRKEEVILAFESIYSKYIKNKKNLSEEEDNRIKKYLDKIPLPKGYVYEEKEEKKRVSEKFLKYEIGRKDYILAYNFLIDAFPGVTHTAKVSKNAGSISDGPTSVDFPSNSDFDKITIERFLKLAMHEFETHMLIDHNSKKLLGLLRGYGSTMKDEGVAILMEQLFLYGNSLLKTEPNGKRIIDVSKIVIDPKMIHLLMGELLSNEELKDFLELSYKIFPDIIVPENRYLRIKRNNKSHVQHKDAVYVRGLLKAIEEINKYILSSGKEGIKPEHMFLGKISFEETNMLVKIQHIKKDLKIIKPMFLADVIYFILKAKISGSQVNNNLIQKYIRKKYEIFDFSYKKERFYSIRAKKRVKGIVNILLKVISTNNINNISGLGKNKKLKDTLNKLLGNQHHVDIKNTYKKLPKEKKEIV